MFNSFRYDNYGQLWLIVALTNAAKWAFTLIVTMQVYDMTHSSFWSGALVFASMAPNIVGAPIVGVLADKMERKTLIFFAVILSLAVLILLFVMTFTHVLAPVSMVFLSMLFGLSSSAIGVSVNAMIPTLVPREGLYNAYSLQAIGQRGTEFVGPILAAPIYAAYGPQNAYLFCGFIYLIAIVFILRFNVPRLSTVDKQPFFRSLSTGLAYILRSESLAPIILLVGLHCALTMAFLGMLPAFVQKSLGFSDHSSFYGILMSMVGLGSIIGTLILAVIDSHKVRTGLFWVSAVVSGLSLAMLGGSLTPALSVVSILLAGASQAIFMTITITLVQEATAEEVRGRVTGVYFVLAAGLMSLTNWLYGSLSIVISPRLIMLVTGLLFTCIVGVYWYVVVKRQTSLMVLDEPNPAGLDVTS